MKILILIMLTGLYTMLFSQANPHKQLKRDCQVCHTSQSWKSVKFDHAVTGLRLRGAHSNLDCVSCHTLANFARVQTDCWSCHTDVHQEKLGKDCASCHSPNSWDIINPVAAHRNTTFPLIGAHSNLDCKNCHRGAVQGEFSMLKSECYSCHAENYQNAANPDHAGSGFSVRCEDCHGMLSWRPANFGNHEQFFPIFSGSHSGVWNNCSDCHISPGNFRVFSCFTCHEHDQARTNDKHREVSGYVYESNACYNCHPRGTGEGAEGGD